MNLLLDTHIFLWAIEDNPKLPKEIRNLILEADQIFVSVASLWECVIKIGLKKLKLDIEALMASLEDLGFNLLPIKPSHLNELLKLPALHKDPFDRLLIAQAKSEPLLFQTIDEAALAYFK